jgi:hypothetical protein
MKIKQLANTTGLVKLSTKDTVAIKGGCGTPTDPRRCR